VIGQLSQLVSANEELQRENRDLAADNVRLQARLREIGDALGPLTAGRDRGRRGGAGAPPEPGRPRRPITDPEVLERKKQALARARAARAEKRAAARTAAGAAGAEATGS
jgi:hypothetical protein